MIITKRPGGRPRRRPGRRSVWPKRSKARRFFFGRFRFFKRQVRWWFLGWVLLRAGIIAFAWLLVAALALVVFFAYDIPLPDEVSALARKPSVTILDRTGDVIGYRGEHGGKVIDVADFPAYIPQAVVAIEDHRFYSHPGLDIISIARAAWRNFRAGRAREGGSTITQQLAKNLFLGRQKTLRRKVQEALLTAWLEFRFTKDEILSAYLNRVYLGGGAYGVDAAARIHFGVRAREVTLYQASMLAGLLRAPGKFAPHAPAAQSRALVVLDAMVRGGYITQAQADKAAKDTISPPIRRGAYFIDWIFARLPEYMGPLDRDVVVRTTLDARLQNRLRAVIAKRFSDAHRDVQVAAIVLDQQGGVRAMIGGRDYRRSQYNRATQARRQPGSTFKTMIYAAALERGVITPQSIIVDAPLLIDGWSPRNFDGAYQGRVTVQQAFAQSINTVAVKVLQRLGLDQAHSFARRLGFRSALTDDLSLALGVSEVTMAELVGAYAPLLNGGYGVFPHGVDVITERQDAEKSAAKNNANNALYRRTAQQGIRVISAQTVAQMRGLLAAAVQEGGTGEQARGGGVVGGKTGTSQDNRDAWFIGLTGQYVVGVWVGFDNAAPMKSVTGGGLPARIFADFVKTF